MERSLVQATSVMEAMFPEPVSPEYRPDAPVLAVETIGLSSSAIFANAVENHRGDFEAVIKKIACQYLSSVSQATITAILNAIDNIVTGSVDVFTMITTAWKFQNCRDYRDEDGRKFFKILANSFDLMNITNVSVARWGNSCDWDISNAVWKKEVLGKLKLIYLTPETADLLYELIGKFHLLERGENGHDRLISYINSDLRIDAGQDDINTYAKFKARLDADIAIIADAFNAYPFMDAILKELGMEQPGDRFNFTRDLAAMRLPIMKDHDNLLCFMAYMLGLPPQTSDEIAESEYIMYRVVSIQGLDGSYFSTYSDEPNSSDQYRYLDRTFIDIVSAVNTFRGSAYPLNISYNYRRLSDNTWHEETVNCFSMLSNVEIDNNLGTYLTIANNRRDQLDMPTDLVYLYIMSVLSDKIYITSSYIVPSPSSGDYVIAEGDIESVISDSCYDFVVNERRVSDFAQAIAAVNTLGNNGSNTALNQANRSSYVPNNKKNRKKKTKDNKPKPAKEAE